MTWRVLATAASEPDFAQLSDDEREALTDDLFAWIETGPPRANLRVVAGVVIFEDVVPSGFRVTYIVNEAEPHVAVLRVRKA